MSVAVDPPPTTARPGWVAPAAYALMALGAAGAFLLVLWAGPAAAGAPAAAAPGPPAAAGPVNVVLHVLATLAAVVGLGLVLGRLMRRLGQPAVVGEVLAGILLGPSLLGAVSPAAMHLLVPGRDVDPGGQVLAAVKAVGQVGVVLYLFLVGVGMNGARFRGRVGATVGIAHAGVAAQLALAAPLALVLYPEFAPAGVPFPPFALFFGVALSVTGFTVLTRLLADAGLARTPVGAQGLGCAAVDDVTAWCLVALVAGVARAEVGAGVATTAGAVAFIGVMFFAVRPLAAWVCAKLEDTDPSPNPSPRGGGEQDNGWLGASSPSPSGGGGRGEGSLDLPGFAVPVLLVAVLLSALAAEAIGVHALFGAFLFGAVIPHDSRLAREATAKLRDVVTVVLLPAFFALTGLRTEIGLVAGWHNWALCGLIVLVATAGKWGGTYAAARFGGYDRRTALALGAMMNTRGLMGLIVLDVGLGMGVISPALFAMMVLMALATTLATAPALRRLIPEPAGRGSGPP